MTALRVFRTGDAILDGHRDFGMTLGAVIILLHKDTISEPNEVFQVTTITVP